MPYYNRDPKRDHSFDNHPFRSLNNSPRKTLQQPLQHPTPTLKAPMRKPMIPYTAHEGASPFREHFNNIIPNLKAPKCPKTLFFNRGYIYIYKRTIYIYIYIDFIYTYTCIDIYIGLKNQRPPLGYLSSTRRLIRGNIASSDGLRRGNGCCGLQGKQGLGV